MLLWPGSELAHITDSQPPHLSDLQHISLGKSRKLPKPALPPAVPSQSHTTQSSLMILQYAQAPCGFHFLIPQALAYLNLAIELSHKDLVLSVLQTSSAYAPLSFKDSHPNPHMVTPALTHMLFPSKCCSLSSLDSQPHPLFKAHQLLKAFPNLPVLKRAPCSEFL